MIGVEIVLALAAFCFLCQALEITWHIGRLTIQPGWVGFTIWGALTALQTAFAQGEDGVGLSPSVLMVVGGVLLAGVTTTMLQAVRIHHLVNDKSDKQIERIDQLVTALEYAGVEVPKRPDDHSAAPE